MYLVRNSSARTVRANKKDINNFLGKKCGHIVSASNISYCSSGRLWISLAFNAAVISYQDEIIACILMQAFKVHM